jgi:glucose/arabinose dehydrogenase
MPITTAGAARAVAAAVAEQPAGDGAPQLGPADADIALNLRVGGLNSPVFITDAGDGSGKFYIVEQTGRIKIWDGDSVFATPFLNLSGTVSGAFEQGLLGLAFHPDYETNRKLYVYFTNRDDDVVLREYRASASNPNVVDTSTKRKVLKIHHPYENHNGGMLAFGPGGYLYIGVGDGGSAGDPGNRAQDKGKLLGKLLRIDVDGRTGSKAYGIPSSNPFVGRAGDNEIWQYGLRNPWRFSFDSQNGNLWIGDVGQSKWEEVDRAINTSSGPGRGINWGWRVLEGSHCYKPPSGCNRSGKTMPVTEYKHTADNGRCSITGGYVYRGDDIPALVGGYLFADYCTGEIFVVNSTAPIGSSRTLLLNTGATISSFGERPNGELFVVDRGGRIYSIVQG